MAPGAGGSRLRRPESRSLAGYHGRAGSSQARRRAQGGKRKGVTPHRVVFTPEAQEQIAEIYRYVASAASPRIAERYASAIVTYCEGLGAFPLRGSRRDDIRKGLG